MFVQVDRAHREFSPEQIEFVANIVRLYRDEEPEFIKGSKEAFKAAFPKLRYQDIAGRCRVAFLKDIEQEGWSLNPGRYVGVVESQELDHNFIDSLKKINQEFENLTLQAEGLQ
jgi:type I restriction enzyme M protein